MAAEKKKKSEMKYGEGQREQYGEGSSYRPEEKTKAADQMGQSDEFAGGDRDTTPKSAPKTKPNTTK